MKTRDVVVAGRNAVALRTLPRKDHVIFIGRSRMYIDRDEPRGQKLLASAGSSRFRNSLLWRAAVEMVRPPIALDVGANYGEVAFSARYRAPTQVILIEANPRLVPFLERSADSLRSWQRDVDVSVVNAAVGAERGHVDFFIDTTFSGTSRISGLEDGREYDRETVHMETIDNIVKAHLPASDLVFKMEIEGAELEALAGMRETLAGISKFIGIVELSEEAQVASGHRMEDYWDYLRDIGRVYLFDANDSLCDCSDLEWTRVRELGPARGLRFGQGADAVIVRGIEDIERASPRSSWKYAERLAKILFPSPPS